MALTDSQGRAYSASNPMPITVVGAETLTEASFSGSSDVQGVAATSGLRLIAVHAWETSGADPASFALYHGVSNAGALLGHWTFAPNESVRDWFPNRGLPCPSGVFVDRLTGSTGITLITEVD